MPYVLPDGRRVAPERAFELSGVQYPRNWLKLSSPDRIAALGIVWEADPPAPEPPPPTKDQLKAAAASHRWQVETGGVTVNGALIRTDETSQTKVLGARVQAKEDANYTLNWKAGDGSWVQLNAATVIAIADAVRAHVQACFDAEMAVAAKIDNDTYTTYADINGASEWP